MEFRYFQPAEALKPYIKHYYVFESAGNAFYEDTVFPSGDMEIIFNLGSGVWECFGHSSFLPNPAVELWGQITKPLRIRSTGSHTMLGVRFFTHSSAFFLEDEIGVFNDRVSDLADILGSDITHLHHRLLETGQAIERVAILDGFFTRKLLRASKKERQLQKVARIVSSITNDPTENNISNVADRYGVTTRYLHKLVYQHTGLSPKHVDKIHRFQTSLRLIGRQSLPLTSVAYDAGYFDQSHFIRDFKAFTGLTPSAYLDNLSSLNQLLAH
ncbi:helix-turn-helix domain-containing protein [Dyadobacter sp. 676]|uniref:Helix-turn-helix domain-containing protein n=1 Tax=Dyadobacter sp. 676 TaxID=3088362 RepID=A0AAU8FPW6_9BACT